LSPSDHRFSCTLCGDCCTGNQVVRLTGDDLKRLVIRLELESVLALRTRGLVSLVREPVGEDLFCWRPRLRFRTRPLVQCPFLENNVGSEGDYRGLCSLHPHDKPLVCQLSPLCREVDDPGQGPVSQTWAFVAPVEGCPGMGRGEPLVLRPPEVLGPLLAREIEWMRFLVAQSPGCPDETAAWELLGRWEVLS